MRLRSTGPAANALAAERIRGACPGSQAVLAPPRRCFSSSLFISCRPRTEESYIGWIRRLSLYHAKRHPSSMGAEEVNAFQSSCTGVSWKSRYRGWMSASGRSGVSAYKWSWAASQDDKADRHVSLPVRTPAAGNRDRITMLPLLVIAALREHLERARDLYDTHVRDGTAGVWLPDALSRKFLMAAHEWSWQRVIAAKRRYEDWSGPVWRHHVHETVVQRAMFCAWERAEIGAAGWLMSGKASAEPAVPARLMVIPAWFSSCIAACAGHFPSSARDVDGRAAHVRRPATGASGRRMSPGAR
jgi:integrase-like protein